jgi:hypothetical protein
MVRNEYAHQLIPRAVGDTGSGSPIRISVRSQPNANENPDAHQPPAAVALNPSAGNRSNVSPPPEAPEEVRAWACNRNQATLSVSEEVSR